MISSGTIHEFFKKESDLLSTIFEIEVPGAPNPSVITITEKGKEYLEFLKRIERYYSDL